MASQKIEEMKKAYKSGGADAARKAGEAYDNKQVAPTTSASVKQAADQKTQEVANKTNKINSTISSITGSTNAKPEYAGQGSTKSPQVNDTSWDTGNGQYTYNAQSGYYESKQPKTEQVSSGKKDFATTWNEYSYEKQQELLNKTPNLKTYLANKGLTVKQPGEATATEETPKAGETTTTPTTPTEKWDYQDNSPERMKEIADNVNGFAQSDPRIFNNEDSFRKFFIDGKGRTPEQEAFLMDLYKNSKKYNELDGYTADNIGYMYAHGQVPDSYLNYLKNSNPERYAEVMDAKDAETNKIKDDASIGTINSMEGGEDITTSNAIEWLKKQGLFVDKDGNLIDDRTENYASEEEQGYLKQIADLNAANLDIDNTVKHTYEDLVKAYPGATKATLMAMAQDMNSDLLREKENNLVELTRLQGYVGYMQSERQERDAVGQNAINQLRNGLMDYYKYSPQGLSEYAQAQYAATNITLDQADQGTETQKQMALDSVLTPIYEQFGSIIQRSKAQVINDVIAYANNKGITLSQALEENFMTPLKNKDAYKQYQKSLTSGLGDGNWTLEPIKDAKGNITGYVRINKTTGDIVPYTGATGEGTVGGTGNFTDYTPITRDELTKGIQNFFSQHPENSEGGQCGSFVNDYLASLGYDRLYTDPIDKKAAITNTDIPSIGSVAVMDSKKYPDNGHTAIVIGIDGDKLKILESNRGGDEKVHTRWINKNDVKYGYFDPSISTGTQDHSDNPARSPMYDAIQEVLDSGDLSSAQLDNLKLADIIYRQFYNLSSDGSLDHFIESKDFQNIMAQMAKQDFTKAGNDEGASFLKYWKKAIEKGNITDQTNLRVIRVLTQMIEKKLRKESGAAISSSEWLSNFENYLPQAGESRANKLATMLDWELNIIEPSMRYSGVKDYKWLFSKNSPYYKTEGSSGNYYSMNTGNNTESPKGTFEIGVGSVTTTPSGGQYDSLFSMLGY